MRKVLRGYAKDKNSNLSYCDDHPKSSIEYALRRRIAEWQASHGGSISDTLDVIGSKQVWSDVLHDCYEPPI
jgi:hypothetical protein